MKTVTTWYKGPTDISMEVEQLSDDELSERRDALKFYGYWQDTSAEKETWWLPHTYVKREEPLKVVIG